MSEFHVAKIDSFLPEDIESLLTKINQEIAALDRKRNESI